MPLDRVSKKFKTEKKNNSNKLSQIPKQKNTKYEKCEYCNRVTTDLNAHIYNCESRRLFEIERIQTKQDENEQKKGRKKSVIMKSNTSLYNIPNSAKRERLNSDFNDSYFKNKLKLKVEKIMRTQDRRYNKTKCLFLEKRRDVSLKTLKMKFPENRDGKLCL